MPRAGVRGRGRGHRAGGGRAPRGRAGRLPRASRTSRSRSTRRSASTRPACPTRTGSRSRATAWRSRSTIRRASATGVCSMSSWTAAADKHGVKYQLSVLTRGGTDAAAMQRQPRRLPDDHPRRPDPLHPHRHRVDPQGRPAERDRPDRRLARWADLDPSYAALQAATPLRGVRARRRTRLPGPAGRRVAAWLPATRRRNVPETPATLRAMTDTQLAVQLYTLRDYTKTPDDIARTFERLAAQGWKAVQCVGDGPDRRPARCASSSTTTAWPAARPTASSTSSPNDTQAAARLPRRDRLPVHGRRRVLPEGRGLHGGQLAQLHQRLQRGRRGKLDGSALSAGYHNHSHEWAHTGDPLTAPRAIDLLIEGLDERLWFELDTYWVAHAGGDPAEPGSEAVGGRIPVRPPQGPGRDERPTSSRT